MEKNLEILRQAIKEKDVKFLCKVYFNKDLTENQCILVRKIAFSEVKRLSVCAMTRWGKSFCVSLGVALYIMFNSDRNIMFLGPKKEQAAILRDYMADLIISCEKLFNLSDIEKSDVKKKIKQEASKNRLTFKNGCEYRIFSAHGDASGLMGFGLGSAGGIIVKDEASLIDDKANAKIMRMAGDNPEEAMIIELCNPWDRDNKAFEHWCNPEWESFHIDWKIAMQEGRTTKQYIDEQRKELTSLEFMVLYDSNFPEQSEDSIFSLKHIKLAEESEINLSEEKEITKIISCDVADKGLDSTVIYWGFEKDGERQVIDHYSEPKSENMNVAGRINNLIKEFIGFETKGIINIDCIGVGTGVVSRVREFVDEEGYTNIHVNACHFGETPKNKKRFSNKKAEYYFKLKDLLQEEMIKIPKISKLNQQLISIKWEFNSKSKIKIIDPDKSPDFADGLVYFVWEEEGGSGVLTDDGSVFGDIQY